MDDAPRSLRLPDELDRRRTALTRPHIAPLAAFAASLREGDFGEVPDFDPYDGGVKAKVLFLFEKPGPMANRSGFISRNNDDLTAAYTFEFMARANLPRLQTCIWNVIPGWNGTIRITATEHAAGIAALEGLSELLPELRAVVLVGKKGLRAHPWATAAGFQIIESAHPSPKVRATAREKWESIPGAWGRAREFLT